MNRTGHKIKLIFTDLCAFLVFNTSTKLLAQNNDSKPIDISTTFTTDTTTEKSITWVTKNPGQIPSVLEIWEEGGTVSIFNGTSETVSAKKEYYPESEKFNAGTNETKLNIHKATASGLKPATIYFYRCSDGTPDHAGDTGTFETGTAAVPFSFIYMTDPQSFTNKNFELWRRTTEHADKKVPDAKFFVISGDLTDRGSSEVLWDKFFSYGARLTERKTIVPAIGNHETDTGPHTFENHFAFPKSKNDLPDYVYSFDYGDAHFMVLTTQMNYSHFTSKDKATKDKAWALLNSQAAWLKEEVRRSIPILAPV